MARRRSRRSRRGGSRKGFIGRVISSLTSPVGLVLLAAGMLTPFLLGGKVREKVEQLASKVKGGA
jgi:hypothetical protein